MSSQEYTTELATSGYVRSYYKETMPPELVGVIQAFYDLYYHWHFKTYEITNFVNSEPGHELQSDPFKIRDITFNLLLFPNGKLNDGKIGFVRYFLYVVDVPPDIDYFGVYCKLICNQTQTQFEFFERFNGCDNYWGWLYPLELSQCKRFQHLCFDCFVDIKHIKYIKDCDKIDFIKVTPIERSISYKWKVDEDILLKLKNRDTVEKVDETQWRPCLFIDEDDQVTIGADFMQFPCDIWSLDAEIIIVNDINDCVISEITNNNSDGFEDIATGLMLSDIVEKQSICFDITLVIIAIYDRQYQSIDMNEWDNIGIV